MTLEEACEALTAIGVSTGHADDWQQLFDETIMNIKEYQSKVEKLASEKEALLNQQAWKGYR